MHQLENEGNAPHRTRWIFAGFLAITLFFLLTEHRAHLYGILPYLLLLACPLMHLFHGHGHHGHHEGPDLPGQSRQTPGESHEP